MIQRSPVRKVRRKPRSGRLKGKAMGDLREAAWQRDKGICQRCFLPCNPNDWDLAHRRGKRMWGDSLENVQVEHRFCHRILFHNPKACPPKPTSVTN